jgi:DivIVA domain-containing protein
MTKMFSTVSRFKLGYEQEDVDEFFDHARAVYEGESDEDLTSREIRSAGFDLARGGYDTDEVDAALDRLESAFVARARQEVLVTRGSAGWMEDLAESARSLYGRLGRPDGERFEPARRGEPAYDRDDVDELCDRLVEYFDKTEPITADEIRRARFRRRTSKRGYAEAPVDAFFSRAVEVLLGVE